MPGGTPYDAYQAFVTPLAMALACVAVAKIQPSAGGMKVLHQDHRLFITRQGDSDYVRLKGDPAFESVIRTAVELGARPLHDDWAERLDATEDLHVRHRSWSADPNREILR